MNPAKPKLADLKPVALPDGRRVQMTQEDLDRIWPRISEDEAGCWLWTGSRFPTGYGQVAIAGASMYAHRLVYMICIGEIEEGLHTDHLCRNPPCCNPAHLEPVTCRENIMRSPIHPAAINARKTHCKAGHPLSGDNLAINANGRRVCRACARLRDAERYAKKKRLSEPTRVTPSEGKTHCPNGHPLDDVNSYVDPRGTRRCRTCAREQLRRWREKKSGGERP